jgi:TRAP-type C4-dicarboxylate transport system substrate-binding protein
VYAVALQIFKDAPHMLDIRVAPLVGATIMTDSAWNRISADDRTKVLAAAATMEQQINSQAPALDAKSIAAMTGAGLQVTRLDPAAAAEFRRAAEQLGTTLRGGMIPADVYDLAVSERETFRKTKPAK